MIQDIGAGRYHNEYRPKPPVSEDYVLFYRGRELFVRCIDNTISFLTYGELISKFPELSGKETYLFELDGRNYYLYRDAQSMQVTFADEPDHHFCDDQTGMAAEHSLISALSVFAEYEWIKIDALRVVGPQEAAFAGVTGFQLYGWYASRRYCPRCGQKTVHDEKERMMKCPSCGQMEYPKICPAVIVAVTDGDRLLLTRYAGRTHKNYALIAGFAEIGESIEETVHREVMEEVGLKVKNLRFYRSQPWSFTDTLLMGFYAELDGESRISLDETELSEGRWCTRDEIPEDDGISLTREMMHQFKINAF